MAWLVGSFCPLTLADFRFAIFFVDEVELGPLVT